MLLKLLKIAQCFHFSFQSLEQIRNEVEDPSEALIDGIHGHGR